MGSKLKRIKGYEFQQIHNIVLFAGPHNQQFFKSYFYKEYNFSNKKSHDNVYGFNCMPCDFGYIYSW